MTCDINQLLLHSFDFRDFFVLSFVQRKEENKGGTLVAISENVPKNNLWFQ